jgi:hypothetical protein
MYALFAEGSVGIHILNVEKDKVLRIIETIPL